MVMLPPYSRRDFHRQGAIGRYSFGQALETFVSSQVGYVSVADDATLEPGTAFTFACWLYKDVATITGRAVMNKWVSSAGNRSMAIHGNLGTIRMFLSVDGNSTSVVATPSMDVATPVGTWQHWAWVYDGSGATDSDKLKIYQDGVEDTSVGYSAAVPASVNDNGQALLLGNMENLNAAGNWDGGLDEVMWYQRALSAEEIALIAGRRRVSDGLVSWWRMEGNVNDSVGSNNGTINGTGTQYIAHT